MRAAPESIRARQAALLLHGLAPSVRQRVIARLDKAEVGRLTPLLTELESLGVPQCLGDDLQQLASAPSPQVTPGSSASPRTARERVQAMSAEDIVQAIKACAPVTVAQLLRAEAWPWKEQALASLPDLRRAEVLRHLSSESPPWAPAVLNAMCERLCLETARRCSKSSSTHESTHRLSSAKRQPATRSIAGELRRWFGWMR